MDQYRMIDRKDFEDCISGVVSVIKLTCKYIVTSVKEYFKTALLTFILALGIGAFCLYHSKMFYEAVMVCTFKEMNKKTYGEMVHALDILAKTHSYSALAKHLNISLYDAACIISIEGKNMAGSMLFEDITEDKSPLYFEVKTTDSKVYPVLETSLLHYLNSNPYLNNKILLDSLDIQSELQSLSKNISIVDSVIATICKGRTPEPFTDTSINASRLVSLIQYKNDMETELTKQEERARLIKGNVEILHGFAPPDKPTNNKNKILQLTIIASFISSVGVAVLRKGLHDGANLQSI